MTDCFRHYPLRSLLIFCAILACGLSAVAQNWVLLSPPPGRPDLTAVHFLSVQTGFVGGVAGGNGRLYRTSNGGITWTPVALPGTPGAINDLHFVNGAFGAAVGNGGYIATTSDGGSIWVQRTIPISEWPLGGDIQGVLFRNQDTGFVVGKASGAGNGPRMAWTVDGGVTWRNIAQQATPANNFYDLDFFDAMRGVAVGTGQPPRKSISTNGGRSWNLYDSLGASGTTSLSFYGVDAVDGTPVAYAAGGKVTPPLPFLGQVRKSTDYAASWSVVSSPGPEPLNGIAAITQSLVFVTGRDGKIFKTTDGGTTWAREALPAGPRPTGVGQSILRRIARTPTHLFAVGEDSLVLSYMIGSDITFSSTLIDFGQPCPGTSRTIDLTIGNVGGADLVIDSIVVTQPAMPGLTYVVVSRPSTVAPGGSGIVRVRADAANTAPGAYPGSMRIYNNDENYTGADRNRQIALAAVVTTKTIAFDNAVQKDAGSLHVGGAFSSAFDLRDVLSNTGVCTVSLNVTLARGIDFSLTAPPLTRLASGEKGSVHLTFEPKSACERYDTIVVAHDAITPASPIRIPIVGRGIVRSFATSPNDTIDFGDITIGSTGESDLRLLNNALAARCLDTTNVYSVSIVGPNASEFTTPFEILPGGRVPIPPHEEKVVTIMARPRTTGKRIAYALISNDLQISPPDTVTLIATGLTAEIIALNNEINYPVTDVGGRRDSTLRDFLQNTGDASVEVISTRIVGIHAADFTYNGPAAPFIMGSGAKRTISVSFNPTQIGPRTAYLDFFTNISSSPIRITLNGTALRSALGYRSSIVLFAPTSLNDCRDTTLVKFIYNPSTVPLRIKTISMADDPGGQPGDASAFSVVAPVIPPELVIAPRDSASITLRFCPKEPRPYFARLELGNNSDTVPFVVQLIGNGRSSEVIAIDSVVFARTRARTTRDTVIDRFIVNRESGPLIVDSITITGADAISFTLLSPAVPLTIPPNGDVPVSLRFNPFRRDRHAAFLNFHTTQGKVLVELRGQAIYPLLLITPDVASLRVPLGSTRKQRIDIVNVGDDSSRLERAVLNGSAAFTNVSTDPLPALMMPGDTIRMMFDFTPDRLCEHNARVAIFGEGVRGVYAIADTNVTFAGIGTGALVASRKEEINFGINYGAGPFDSTLNDFLGNIDFTGALSHCIDPATIDSMVIAGPESANFALLSPADPLSSRALPVGAMQPIALRFQPSTLGQKSAELLVYHGGRGDSILRITLLGALSTLPIEYGPTKNMFEIDFGNVRLGSDRDSLFTAKNISGVPITIDELSSTLPLEMVILSPTGSFVMQPDQPVEIRVRFSPRTIYGRREAYTRFRSGTEIDSSFRLVGNAVGGLFRSESDPVDFGTHVSGTQVDTAVVLLNEPIDGVPDIGSIDTALIDDARMVAGGADFDVLSFPRRIEPGRRDTIVLRFRASNPPGRRDGVARIYHNRRIVGSDTLRDSIDIRVSGVVAGEAIMLHAALGPGAMASPGERVRYPIILSGDLAGAAIDTLDIALGFRKTLLKPLSVVGAQPGVTAALELTPDLPTTRGEAFVRIGSGGAPLAAGTVAEVEFLVLLGDTMETMIRYDSISVHDRINLLFTTDSARFAIADFCDAEGRLIRFDSLLTFVTKPNPAARATSLSYTLPAIVHVQLSIYNAAGDEVARLADGVQQPGYYYVPVDLSLLASGTYYCILTAGRFTKTLTLQILE